MQKQTLGTCSICGGPVTCPLFYWSTVPPVPKCEGCGATGGHGPVIQMTPVRSCPQHGDKCSLRDLAIYGAKTTDGSGH